MDRNWRSNAAHTCAQPMTRRVDETYIEVKGEWKYLYRAVDSNGNTLEFLLTARRDTAAAKRFLCKVLKAFHTTEPRVINVDHNAAYPKAIDALKAEKELLLKVELFLSLIIFCNTNHYSQAQI